LSAAYTDTLAVGDLSVKLVNDNGYSRDLYVMSVDNSAKTFIVKFNGAPMGAYKFQVTSSSASAYGRIDTSAVTLTTSSTVTSITPKTGSVYGGTLLTIQGTNFSTTKLD